MLQLPLSSDLLAAALRGCIVSISPSLHAEQSSLPAGRMAPDGYGMDISLVATSVCAAKQVRLYPV